MTSKADKLPLETEPVARDNNTILSLKRGGQTLSRLTQLIIVVSNDCRYIFCMPAYGDILILSYQIYYEIPRFCDFDVIMILF